LSKTIPQKVGHRSRGSQSFCRCGSLRFVIAFSKLDLVAFQRVRLNRPGKKQTSGFGLSPVIVTKVK